ncbi:MAG: acyl-CoA dehydrogenase [Chloroflexi bacterium]|nr:acyl-CoA dehydrogenase [Chloroflexota bacterium]
MEFAFTPEQEKFARDLRDYIKAHMTPELAADLERQDMTKGPAHAAFIRQMGEDGWLGIGWPKEYGGQGRTPIEQHIFSEIMSYEHIALPEMALNAVGPAIMRVGTEAQKKKFLPPILRGEMEIAIGYSEPEAGSDLASLKTSAIRQGDEYIINGQKVFTSCAHYAQYLWLATRTDPKAPKHKGISVFMIPMNHPGITIKPMYLVGGERLNSTFLDDVRVPKEWIIGEENKGWKYMTTQLDFERVAISPSGSLRRNIEDVSRWAKETIMDGKAIIDRPEVKRKLAELTVEVETLRMLNLQVAWMVTTGKVPFAEASAVKVWGSELRNRVNGALLEVLGQFGQLQKDSKWAPLRGRIEHAFRFDVIFTFGGGAVEIQRDIIAQVALGLPRM